MKYSPGSTAMVNLPEVSVIPPAERTESGRRMTETDAYGSGWEARSVTVPLITGSPAVNLPGPWPVRAKNVKMKAGRKIATADERVF